MTDIVRHADELEVLRGALDNVSEGVVMLDNTLNAQFLNKKMRTFWGVTEEQAARRPSYESLIRNSPHANDRGMTGPTGRFYASRVAAVARRQRAAADLRTTDGRNVRAHCALLKNGGRMLTYCDVTHLVRNAQQMEELADHRFDDGPANRRYFWTLATAEWSRFQRYYRPLSC